MVKVNVGTTNKVKAEAVRTVFEKLFDLLQIKLVEVDPGVPEEPFEEEIALGAVRRARVALQDADYGVGIEAGLIWNEHLKVYFDVQFCAIIDQTGKITVGHGPGFVYPDRVIAQVKRGRPVGGVMSEITGIKDIGKKDGSVGFLSKNLLTRSELTEQAVIAALIPRIREELYR